jgi:hypothetical protein
VAGWFLQYADPLLKVGSCVLWIMLEVL